MTTNSLTYLDTETIGLTGPVVLIQYSTDITEDGVELYYPWKEPVQKTLDLIHSLLTNNLCIYNATFDSFALTHLYNIFNLVKDKFQLPNLQEVYEIDQKFDYTKAIALKPKSCLDPFLILRKTILQYLVSKDPVLIRKIPIQATNQLKEELERFAKDELSPLLFKNYSNKSEFWTVEPNEDDKNFVDFKLSFAPSTRLKDVVNFLFNKQVYFIEMPERYYPRELPFAPTNQDWLRVFHHHINYWNTEDGIRYAKQDIVVLKQLTEKLIVDGVIKENQSDEDSELAWAVGTSRYKGFSIDRDKLYSLIKSVESNELNIKTDPRAALKWLLEALMPEEKLLKLLLTKTDKKTLIAIINTKPESKVAERAKIILEQRKLQKELNLLKKIQLVGRFHPDFNIVGTASNRMSGTGKINAQGINKKKVVREIFTLADSDYILSGGDYKQQEAAVLAAIVNSPRLNEILKSGIKIHQIVGSYLYNKPMEQIVDDEYSQSKNWFYAYIYGAFEEKLAQTGRVSIEQVRKALIQLTGDMPEILAEKKLIEKKFCSMKQVAGIGSKVIWSDPDDKVASLFGFERDFSVENEISKYLFDLSTNLIPEIKELKGRVFRRDREQSITGAIQSALLGTAFQIQAANLRQAGNHRIQATGAKCTKYLQLKIWGLQSVGVGEFIVQPFNVHDELQVPNKCPEKVKEVVNETINELKSTVPLLAIDWHEKMKSWGDK